MEQLISEGHCLFCNKVFKKSGINRHLNAHLESKSKENSEVGTSCHLRIELSSRWGGKSSWFLNLWVNGRTTLNALDQFLRKIWLECCGHMSAFFVAGSRAEIPMSKTMDQIFSKHENLTYQYDFGSTTELEIHLVGVFSMPASEKIVLLSRNEPLAMMCSSCEKKPAEQVCTVCFYDDDASFCADCAVKHEEECGDFAEYAAMPVVNSPRVAVCGYEGGTIDVERDGVYRK